MQTLPGTPDGAAPPPRAGSSLEELYLENVPLLDQIARFLAHRHRLSAADAEDLASRVKMKVFEDDYEVLRRFQGRSSLRTYLTIVATRVYVDGCVAESGPWRPSAEATRLGPAAERLEELVSRDGLDVEEAVQVVKSAQGGDTDDLRALARRLPNRSQRRRFVGEDAMAALPARGTGAESRVLAREERASAAKTRDALRGALDALPPQDRLILRMRYADSFQIAEIASALRLPARPLYKRLDRLLARLKTRLVEAGLDGGGVLELIGRPAANLDSGLGGGENRTSRPSPESDEDR